MALLVASMGCWIERHAETRIEYLKVEDRLLRSRFGRRRVLFSDAERHTLATLAKEIGTEALRALDPLVSPGYVIALASAACSAEVDVLGEAAARKAPHKVDVEQLVVRMARENPGWGFTRIHGALRNLDIKVGRDTIRRILKDPLMEPALAPAVDVFHGRCF